MPKTYAALALKEEGPHVLVVTLNRPEVLNAINTQIRRYTGKTRIEGSNPSHSASQLV